MFKTSPFLFNMPDLFRVKKDTLAEMLKFKGVDEEQEKPRPTKKRRKRRK